MSKFKTVNYQIEFDVAFTAGVIASEKSDIAYALAKAVDEVLKRYALTHTFVQTRMEESK